jgi:uncharacterized protein with PIN domain
MVRYLKAIFQHRCPVCKEPLRSVRSHLLCEKICPNGHFREETYPDLGVRIVYENKD